MSTNTTNYNLTKLDGSDLGAIIEINGNVDKIDAALKQNHDDQQLHTENKDNPHSVTKAQVGLMNVDNTADADKPISAAQQNALNKKADLSSDGKVPAAQLPSYVDDVLEYTAKAGFPATGEPGKIYVDRTTNLTYRWSGCDYVEISPTIALGETASSAYRGDRGKAAYDHSQEPHARADATKTEASGEMGHVRIDGIDVEVVSKAMLRDFVYPIGTIIQTTRTQAQFDPNTMLGGTWKRLKGVFLYGSESDANLSSSLKDGGEKVHKLEISEMPSHGNHLFREYDYSGLSGTPGYYMNSDINMCNVGTNFARMWNVWNGNEGYPAGASIGGTQPHNNMPPYKVVNIWERKA